MVPGNIAGLKCKTVSILFLIQYHTSRLPRNIWVSQQFGWKPQKENGIKLTGFTEWVIEGLQQTINLHQTTSCVIISDQSIVVTCNFLWTSFKDLRLSIVIVYFFISRLFIVLKQRVEIVFITNNCCIFLQSFVQWLRLKQ